MFAVQINHIPTLEFQTISVSLVSMEIELTKFFFLFVMWSRPQSVEESSMSSKQIEDCAVSCSALYTDAPLCCSHTQSYLQREWVYFVMKTLDCRSFQHHSISQMSDFHFVNKKSFDWVHRLPADLQSDAWQQLLSDGTTGMNRQDKRRRETCFLSFNFSKHFQRVFSLHTNMSHCLEFHNSEYKGSYHILKGNVMHWV